VSVSKRPLTNAMKRHLLELRSAPFWSPANSGEWACARALHRRGLLISHPGRGSQPYELSPMGRAEADRLAAEAVPRVKVILASHAPAAVDYCRREGIDPYSPHVVIATSVDKVQGLKLRRQDIYWVGEFESRPNAEPILAALEACYID